MEREEECFSRNEIESAEENEKKYCSLSQWLRAVWRECLQENLRGMQSSCVMCRCFHVCVCVSVRPTSSRNEQNKPFEYEKMWSLFNISTHISNIHIYIFCTMNISLVCNLSELIIASRLCHKYIIHSAIWSLCTRVSLLYMSHECVTHSTCMNQKQNHKSLKLLLREE